MENSLISKAPFIIAELSGNHNQSLERALELVKVAAECGAHAVKLQTYTPDSLTIDHKGGLFDIKDPNSLWKDRNLYNLYQEAMTPYEWHKPIFDYARELGIIPFSTPFDEDAVDFLEDLNCSIYKVASFENNHHPLLKKIASTGKPIIMSTGVSTLDGLAESVDVLKKGGCKDLTLLKCTSTYPSTPANTNLRTIPHLKDLFNCKVGLSDHTLGIGVSVAAVALGAEVIEKHFCLSRAEGGVDSAFSMEPHELRALVDETQRAWEGLGHIQYGILDIEKNSLNFKRSIYIVNDIAEGKEFTAENIRIIRPGDGLAPKYIDHIIGHRAKTDLKRGTPLSWDLLL